MKTSTFEIKAWDEDDALDLAIDAIMNEAYNRNDGDSLFKITIMVSDEDDIRGF